MKTVAVTGATQTLALTNVAEGTAGMLTIQITGTFSAGTISIQGSLDGGTTKVALLMVPWGSATGVTSASANGAWRVDASGIPLTYAVSDGSFSGSVSVYVQPVIG